MAVGTAALLVLFCLLLPIHGISVSQEADRAYLRERLKEIRAEMVAKLKLQSEGFGNAPEVTMVNDNSNPKEYQEEIADDEHNILSINVKAGIAKDLFGGDVRLTREQIDELYPPSGSRARRQAYIKGYPVTTWQDGFYYYFDEYMSAQGILRINHKGNKIGTPQERVARKAIEIWQNNTCIDFIESKDAEYRVRFFIEDGCWSTYLGRLPLANQPQEISLGYGCETIGTAVHEIAHALGFFHEQARYDRDDYIQVNKENIDVGWISQFDKATRETNDNYGMPYDYGSVMHYPGSYRGNNWMSARSPQHQMTMGSQILSFRDISVMNEHYGCKEKCASYSTKCENGGFPHPRDCTTCLCPLGYGGDDCTEMMSYYGRTITASTTPAIYKVSPHCSIGEDAAVLDEFGYLIEFIEAPAGKRVKATLKSFDIYGGHPKCFPGCPYGGVEFRLEPTLTGPRYCCQDNGGDVVLTSTTEILEIISFNRAHCQEFIVEYVVVEGGEHDCSRCVCPDFFKGDTCAEAVNEKILGENVHETMLSTYHRREDLQSTSAYAPAITLFTGPTGKRFSVSYIASEVESKECDSDCPTYHLEVFDSSDWMHPIRRSCCFADGVKTFETSSNRVGLRLWAQTVGRGPIQFNYTVS